MPLVLLCRAIGTLLAWLPERWVKALTVAAGEILYRLPLERTRVLRSNLHHAFPERDEAWRKTIAKMACHRLFEMSAFALASPRFDEEWYRSHVEVTDESLAHCRRVTTEGGGIFLVPHVTLFESLCVLPLFVPEGKGEPVIFRPLNQPSLDRWVKTTRERWGVRLISRREGMTAIHRQLREMGSLTMLFDQNVGKRGLLFYFMKRLASGTHYPGLLCRKFRLRPYLLLPRREGFWRVRIHCEPLPAPEEPIDVILSSHAALERYLRESDEACADWLWFHTRWKTSKSPKRRFGIPWNGSGLERSVRFFGWPVHPRRTRLWIRMPNWLGDAVIALPLLRALRASRPDIELTLLGRPHLAPLLERFGVADRVLALPAKKAFVWHHYRYFRDRRSEFPDVCLCLTNSFRGDLEAWLTGVPERFGMIRPGRRRPLLTAGWKMAKTLDETRAHQLEVWEKMFRHYGLTAPLDKEPMAGVPPPRTGGVGMICGTENTPEKRWPVERWRELIEGLLARREGECIRLYGTARDRDITRRVAAGFPPERVIDLAGETDLDTFMDELATCRIVICNDTGGMHLANLMGVPVVAIFGPTNPLRTGPVFAAPLRILQPPGCPETGGAAIDGVTADRVLEAVESLQEGSVRSV